MASRKSKLWQLAGQQEISKSDIESANITKDNLVSYVFKVNKDQIIYNSIMNIFGEFGGKSLACPYDLLEVPPGTFTYYTDKEKTKKKSNTNKFTTTIGIYLFNVYLRDFNFSRLFDGYLNKTINKKVYGSIEQTLSFALLEDEIDTQSLKEFEDTIQWFMPFETVLSPNHTEKMIVCTKAINKKKEELIKKYKKELESGDPVIAEKVEQELLKYAAEIMGDDPSMDTIYSGAGGDWDNNFKNMFVMKGAISDPDPNAKQKYRIVTGNYIDGIPVDEYSIVAGAGVQGAYARGKKTEVGGYYEKLFVAAFQHIKLDPKGSDCGTKGYIIVRLTDKNIKDYIYSYIINNNGTLTLIDSKNMKSFIGKTVKLRFSSMCISKTGICNKCAGELFYLLGDNRVGINLAQIPDTLKLRSMKGFHNSIIQTKKIDVMKAFFPWDNE